MGAFTQWIWHIWPYILMLIVTETMKRIDDKKYQLMWSGIGFIIAVAYLFK